MWTKKKLHITHTHTWTKTNQTKDVSNKPILFCSSLSSSIISLSLSLEIDDANQLELANEKRKKNMATHDCMMWNTIYAKILDTRWNADSDSDYYKRIKTRTKAKPIQYRWWMEKERNREKKTKTITIGCGNAGLASLKRIRENRFSRNWSRPKPRRLKMTVIILTFIINVVDVQ